MGFCALTANGAVNCRFALGWADGFLSRKRVKEPFVDGQDHVATAGSGTRDDSARQPDNRRDGSVRAAGKLNGLFA
jgi:hypothetical protein